MHEHSGYGIAVQCDHSQLDQVEALFARVQREAGKLDLLVNNAWGGHKSFDGKFHSPFWEQPLSHWDAVFERGMRNHWLSSRCAAPLLVAQKRGLISRKRPQQLSLTGGLAVMPCRQRRDT